MKVKDLEKGGVQRRTFMSTALLAMTGGGAASPETFAVTRGPASIPPPPPSHATVHPAPDSTLTSITLLSGSAGKRPWCCGQAFKRGDVPAGSSLAGVQMTVKSTWPDGSARWAVLCGITDFRTSAETISVSLGVKSGGSALTTEKLKATEITATVDARAFGSASWYGADWDIPFESWVSGPVMSSWVYRKPIGADAHLVAWLEVRLWATGDVEVLPWVENGYLLVPGATNKDATYSFNLSGAQRFSEFIDLPNHTRTPLIGASSPRGGAELSYWLGDPKTVIPRHESAYLMATEMVPTYGAVTPRTSNAVTKLPTKYSPLQLGSFPAGMGTAGYDKSIGLLPEWDVVYLTSDAPGIYESIERNGFSAGRYGIVHRDEATNRAVRFADHPNTVLGPGHNAGVSDESGPVKGSISTPPGSGTPPSGWRTSHHPSIGFMAALISGRRYHLDTLQFSAGVGYLKQRIDRRERANGVIQPYVLANTTRGAAWSLRTLAQAAALTPDDDPLKASLVKSWEANIEAYHLDNVVIIKHPQGFIHSPPTDEGAYSRSGPTGAGSTSTSVVCSGMSSKTDYTRGWDLHIGGEVRKILGYDAATASATVETPFTVNTRAVKYYAEIAPVFIIAPWQFDFMTATFGWGLALEITPLARARVKLAELFEYACESVLGRIGSDAQDEFLFRDMGQYHICIAPFMRPAWVANGGPWYENWGQIWATSYKLDQKGMGPKDVGDRTLRGDGNILAGSYLANAQPAISYAVRHGVAGAAEKYAKLRSAPNWPAFLGNLNISPVWAVVPPSILSSPAPAPALAPALALTRPAGFPYPLPAPGMAKAISLNLPKDVKPSGWTDSQWHYSVFGSYGGGTFVPRYSKHGAWAIAGTGGHGHPDYTGALVFNFSTGLWEQLPAINPGAPQGSTAIRLASGVNDAALLEIIGTKEVPAPAHPYQMQCYMPKGQKGSLIYVMRAAVTDASVNTSYSHRFDLATRMWSRVAGPGQNWGGFEASAVYDAARNRWWLSPVALHYLKVQPYLDGFDMIWKTTRTFAAASSQMAVYSRLMLHDGMLVKNCGPLRGLWLFDPEASESGWTRLPVSGTLPGIADPVVLGGLNAWARYSDGRWYAYNGFPGEGNTLTRITPPAHPKAGTWIVDTVTVKGDALTAYSDNIRTPKHYTRFFYVASLDCLCWIPGANSAVYLIKPI